MGNYALNKLDKESGEITGTMDIEVRAYPIAEPKGITKGYASVTIDGMFGAHGISIIEGKNGLFVSMPQTKDNKGNYRDIFHPVTSEARKELNGIILSEHSAALESLIAKHESTLDKIREGAKAAKENPAPEKAAKSAGKGSKNKANDAL